MQSSEASDGSSTCVSLRVPQGEVQCIGKSKDFYTVADMVEYNEGLIGYLCHMFGINNRVNRVGRALSFCHS